MSDDPNVRTIAKVEIDGTVKDIELGNFLYLPRIGETVVLDSWHGNKLTFSVYDVQYFVFNSGATMVQYVTLFGKAQ